MRLPFSGIALSATAAVLLVLTCLEVYHTRRLACSCDPPTIEVKRTVVQDRCNSSSDSREITPADEVIWLETGFDKLDDPRLLRDLTRRWLLAPPRFARRNNTKSETKDFSQRGQSQIVDGLLRGRQNGFFVESGASTGEFISNSLYFELARNWSGLLIEPNPSSYRELLQKKRSVYSINACLAATNQTGAFPFVLNFDWGGLVEQHTGYKTKQPVLNIQCFNLYSIMLAIGRTHIDYFSLDVEGAELDILSTIPFEKLTIDVFTIEYRTINNVGSLPRLQKFRDFFKAKGNYLDVGVIPRGSDNDGLDIVFQRKPTI